MASSASTACGSSSGEQQRATCACSGSSTPSSRRATAAWVGTESGVLGRIRDETLTAVDVGAPVVGVLEARNGDALIATHDRVLRYRPGRPLVPIEEGKLPARFVSGPVQARDGSIWITTEAGLVRVDGRAQSAAVVRAGRLWLISDGNGDVLPPALAGPRESGRRCMRHHRSFIPRHSVVRCQPPR
jgi:ligand-binding sensor domain-containing protein